MIRIAVDAMGGDNSPKKIIDGIINHHLSNNHVFYKIFGDEQKIKEYLDGKIKTNNFEIKNISYSQLPLNYFL